MGLWELIAIFLEENPPSSRGSSEKPPHPKEQTTTVSPTWAEEPGQPVNGPDSFVVDPEDEHLCYESGDGPYDGDNGYDDDLVDFYDDPERY